MPIPIKNQYLIEWKQGKWYLNYGGIHGLPTDKDKVKQIHISIYKNTTDEKDPIVQAPVQEVLLGETILQIKDKVLDTSKTYWGRIENTPTTLAINVEGKPHHVERFLKKYFKNPSPTLQLIENFPSAKYTLRVWSRKLEILHTESRRLIHGKRGMSIAVAKYISQQLEQVQHWENLVHLQNEQASNKLSDEVELTFSKEVADGQLVALKGNPINIDYWKKGNDLTAAGQPKPIWYQISATNKSKQALYVSLIYLSSKFGVATHLPATLLPPKTTLLLDKKHGLAILDKNSNQATDIFKVLISTQAFDANTYELEEIQQTVTRTISRSFQKPAKQAWDAKTIVVNLTRGQKKLTDHTLHFQSEGISLNTSADFKADVVFLPIKTATRSLQATNGLEKLLGDPAIEFVNLAKRSTRSTYYQDKSIIELRNVKNEASLKKHPLELTIHKKLKTGENILPVTVKGGFIIPFGESSQTKAGKTIIRIREFPAADAAPSTVGKRGLGKALWFGLLKLTGFRDKAFRLRKVTYNAKGKVIRNEINLFPSIDKAKKILLVVHGVIGDTKPMLQNLEFLLVKQQYDLILAYDYESLNEPIERSAATLNKRLEKFNLGDKDGKHIDLLAHSMGGLVSRYMIEHIRKGDSLIDRLIMFGTPNGGSIFGDIPAYRDVLIKLVAIALNFGKPWLGPLGKFLSGVNQALIASKALTVTLEQMSPSSPFIENLYKNGVKRHTKYTIIAGDITFYDKEQDQFFNKFKEQVLLKIGNVANRNTPNDIAVLVEQIKAIPATLAAEEHDIACHHLNYFDEGAGLETLKTILKSD